jgi:hypothetical protein
LATQKPVRNVFISFHTDDIAQVQLLREQAKSERFDLEFRDYSVKEPFDEKWKTQCAERIAQTSATICMIGEHTYEREGVNWELEKSFELGKKVIPVRIYRNKCHRIPEPIKSRGIRALKWNIGDIVNELDKD